MSLNLQNLNFERAALQSNRIFRWRKIQGFIQPPQPTSTSVKFRQITSRQKKNKKMILFPRHDTFLISRIFAYQSKQQKLSNEFK